MEDKIKEKILKLKNDKKVLEDYVSVFKKNKKANELFKENLNFNKLFEKSRDIDE